MNLLKKAILTMVLSIVTLLPFTACNLGTDSTQIKVDDVVLKNEIFDIAYAFASYVDSKSRDYVCFNYGIILPDGNIKHCCIDKKLTYHSDNEWFPYEIGTNIFVGEKNQIEFTIDENTNTTIDYKITLTKETLSDIGR